VVGEERRRIAGSFYRGDRLSGWGVRGLVALVGKFMKRVKCSESFVKNKLK
jgi:hypothetical protein